MVKVVNITILGAGSYALALALRFNYNKNKIIIWSKVKEEIDVLTKTKMNEKALKNVKMPSNILYTTNIEKALDGSNIVVLAVATKYLKSVCLEIKPYVKDKHIVIASKGIDRESNLFASNIVKDVLKTKKVCTISGPSFAKDMASNGLIGLSLAATNRYTKDDVIKSLESDILKIRPTKDFIGVELCGTMKNVIAVASGILSGMNIIESTKAMFLTESINDVRILIRKLKGNEKTILSFAGIGDILLTCSSESSRNYSFGKMIGQGKSTKELKEYLDNNTVEGVYTLKSVYDLIKKKNINAPFICLIYDIVFNGKDANDLVTFLRDKK